MIAVEHVLPNRGSKRTARCEYRTFPEVKEAIANAAALVGLDETTFAMSAAYKAARKVEECEHQTLIPLNHQEAFLKALEAPAKKLSGLAAMAAEDLFSAEDG